jgi:hypothetical protein
LFTIFVGHAESRPVAETVGRCIVKTVTHADLVLQGLTLFVKGLRPYLAWVVQECYITIVYLEKRVKFRHILAPYATIEPVMTQTIFHNLKYL